MTIHIREETVEVDDSTRIALPEDAPQFYMPYFKRAVEFVLVLLSLPIVLPFVGLCAAMISLNGGSPFYGQKRIGRNNRVFTMWKLRTMQPNADEMLSTYLAQNPQARAEWNRTQKLKKDPRITPIGRVLRKTSMDELPQLFNVVNGTMSLIGPRPMMLSQQKMYYGEAYYDLRPGITGLWQVSDRNDCDFVGRIHYDNEYKRISGLVTDAKILWKTVAVVLRGTGH